MSTLILRVIVLAALVAPCALAQEPPPPKGIETLAENVPRDYSGLICMENPEKLMADIAGFLDQVGVPAVTEAWRQMGEKSAAGIGFDVTTPEGWRKAGFDPSRPVGLALRPDVSNRTFLISLGTLDPAAVLQTLEKALTPVGIRLEKVPGSDPAVYAPRGAAPAILALGFKGERVFILVSDQAAEGPSAILKGILDRPASDSVAADPAFRKLVRELPREAWFTTYSGADQLQSDLVLRALSADEALRPLMKYLRAVKGAAYAVGERDSAWIFALDPQAGLAAAFPPGLGCAAALGRLDRPVFAASLSLDWSGEMMKLVRQALGSDSGLGRLTKGSPLAFLGEPKGKGALGLAFYPVKGPKESYEYVAVARFEDTATLEDVLKRATGQADPIPTAAGGGEYYAPTETNPAVALGRVGDTLLVGAPARVRAALEAKEPRWKPRCGGVEPFMAEVWPGDLLEGLGDMGSEEASRAFAVVFPPDSCITLAHSLGEDIAVIRVRTEGGRFMLPGVVGVIAVPALLESKRAAQHTATIAMLRNLGSAQVAFSSKVGNDNRYGTFKEMVEQGFLDSRFAAPEPVIDGFAYSMSGGSETFKAVARGQGADAGTLYAINENLVVCTDEACTKPLGADEPRGRAGSFAAVALLRNLGSAEVAFSSKIGNDGRYGTLEEMCRQRIIDTRFKEANPLIDGFRFTAEVGKDKFKIVARGEGEFEGQVYAINETLVVYTDEECTRLLNTASPLEGADRFSGWESTPGSPDRNLFVEMARKNGPDPVQILRNIASAEIAFSSKIGNQGRYGTIAEMEAQGFLDPRFKASRVVIDDFVYMSTVSGDKFKIVARGIGPNKGKLFVVDENLVVCTDEACTQPVGAE